MSIEETVRAWREPTFRQTLNADPGRLPHPAGPAVIADWNTGFGDDTGFTAGPTCGGTSKTAARCCC